MSCNSLNRDWRCYWQMDSTIKWWIDFGSSLFSFFLLFYSSQLTMMKRSCCSVFHYFGFGFWRSFCSEWVLYLAFGFLYKSICFFERHKIFLSWYRSRSCENDHLSFLQYTLLVFSTFTVAPMSEEIEKHVVRKFEICQRLGKGVSCNNCALLDANVSYLYSIYLFVRHMVLFGRQLKSVHVRLLPWRNALMLSVMEQMPSVLFVRLCIFR